MRTRTMPTMALATAAVLAACAASAAPPCVPVYTQRIQAGATPIFALFGAAVQVNEDVAIVGAFLEDFTGAAYIFRLQGGSWVQEARLAPADLELGSYFGSAVGIHGATAVVGAPGTDLGGGDIPGAAYIFERIGNVWVQTRRLTGSPGEEFGAAVGVSDGRVMVGDPADDEGGENAGAVYVYKFTANDWVQEDKIIASDSTPEDAFGSAIFLEQERAIIGAVFNDQSNIESGAAYIYIYNGLFWFKQAKIAPADPEQEKLFGFAVHIRGDTAIVGAPLDDGAGEDAGAAYVFQWDGVEWGQKAKLTAPTTSAGDLFGNAVAVSESHLAVGAYLDSDTGAGANAGVVHVFSGSLSDWENTWTVVPSPHASGDSYGIAISADSLRVLVGSLGGPSGFLSGSAYFYDFPPPVLGDADGNRVVDFRDITSILLHYGTSPAQGGSMPGDASRDGIVNFADITEALLNYGADCR